MLASMWDFRFLLKTTQPHSPRHSAMLWITYVSFLTGSHLLRNIICQKCTTPNSSDLPCGSHARNSKQQQSCGDYYHTIITWDRMTRTAKLCFATQLYFFVLFHCFTDVYKVKMMYKICTAFVKSMRLTWRSLLSTQLCEHLKKKKANKNSSISTL